VRSKTKAKAARLLPISLMNHLPAPAAHIRIHTQIPIATWHMAPGHMAVDRGRAKTKAKDQLPSGQDMRK
jgi:hypothetical protein